MATLNRTMSENEFYQWRLYAASRLLPVRRMEVYAAQLCSVIAQTSGNAESKLSDFLLDFNPKPAKLKPKNHGAAIIGAIAGRKIIKLGQGKKRGD